MGRRHFKPEQLIHMLREAEIKLGGWQEDWLDMSRTGDIRAELLPLAKRVRRDASITSEEAQGSGARERATEEAGGESGSG